jgi:predicted site-specific integrase-resolvase
MELIFIPFLSRERFALLVGISEDVLERWIRDGRVRTFRIGKRSLVDLRQWLNESTSTSD